MKLEGCPLILGRVFEETNKSVSFVVDEKSELFLLGRNSVVIFRSISVDSLLRSLRGTRKCLCR